MSNLVEHARRELELSGVDNDIYGDMTSKAVLELVEVFSKQGHSGMSAGLVLTLFSKVARFENLTPLTNDPAEWSPVGEDLWQNNRDSSCFSRDGGKTYVKNSVYDTNTFDGSIRRDELGRKVQTLFVSEEAGK